MNAARPRVARSRATIAFAAAILVAAGCAEANELEFDPELNVDLSRMEQRDGGLYVEDVQPGTGETAAAGDLVVVHYTGWLANGREFDTSRDSGTPLEIVIGEGAVIDGWDQGIPGMRVGGQRRLVIPPELAYGARGAGGGVIPPHATLVFDVELIDTRPVTTLPAEPPDSSSPVAASTVMSGLFGWLWS